jgi:hypothetical protein
MTVWLTIEILDPAFLEPVITSLFCQGVALASLWHFYSYRVNEVDFDVYRTNAGASTPDASARSV